MIVMTTFLLYCLALLPIGIAPYTTVPSNQPSRTISTTIDGTPLTVDELELLLAKLEQSFVELVSDDRKTKQGWGLVYETNEINGLMVRSLDLYRQGKFVTEVVATSGDKGLVVIKKQWTTEPKTGRALTFSYDNTFRVPDEGSVVGILLYPGRDGTVHRTKLELLCTKADETKFETHGQVRFNLPGDHDSGVGIFVRNDGKMIAISLDSSEKSIVTENWLEYNRPAAIRFFDLRGRQSFVDPLTNVNEVSLDLTIEDELSQIGKSDVLTYLVSFLQEECPRLILAPSSLKPSVNPLGVYEPKTKVERNAIHNLLSRYDKLTCPTLLLTVKRDTNGLFIAELRVKGFVQSNGGDTGAWLYTHARAGVTKGNSTNVMGDIKSLVKRFAYNWIDANPGERK